MKDSWDNSSKQRTLNFIKILLVLIKSVEALDKLQYQYQWNYKLNKRQKGKYICSQNYPKTASQHYVKIKN